MDARWRSSPTSSGDRRSACASTRRTRPACSMTEDWVKIRGDQLAPRDGVYDLRDHRGAVGDAFLRSRVADGRRSSRRHRGLRRRALRGPAAGARQVVTTGPLQPFASRARRHTGSDVRRRGRSATAALSRFRRPRRLPGHHAPITASRSSCRTRRRATGRCGWWRRAGSIRPTARSTSRSRRGATSRRKGCRFRWPTASGRFREVPHGPGLSRRQEQDDPGRSDRVFGAAAGHATTAPGDEPGDLLGSLGMGGRPADDAVHVTPRLELRDRGPLAIAAIPSRTSRTRASPSVRATRSRAPAAVARPRGLLHAVR